MKYYKFIIDNANLPYKELTLFYRHIKVINRSGDNVNIYLQGELIGIIEANEYHTFLDFNNEPKKDKYYNISSDTFMQGKILKFEATNLNQTIEVYNYGT